MALPAVPLASRRARPRRSCARSRSTAPACAASATHDPRARLRDDVAASPQVADRPAAVRPACSCSTSTAMAAQLSPARARADDAARRSGSPRSTPGDGRHVDARARAAPRRARSSSRPASSTCSTRSGSARCRSRSAATRPAPAPLVHTVRAVGAGRRGRSARREPGDVLGVRGPYGNAWPLGEAAGGDVVDRRRRHRPGPAAPGDPARCSRERERLRRHRTAVRQRARRPTCSTAKSCDAWRARFDLQVEVTVDTAGRGVARQGRRGDRSSIEHAPSSTRRATVAMRVRPGDHDALRGRARSRERGVADRADLPLDGAQHAAAASATAGTASSARRSSAGTAPCTARTRSRRWLASAGAVSADAASPRSPSGSSPRATAASCRCSTARTSCWRWPGEVEIAYFLEAISATVEGPYDLSLVEGSITTPHDAERIQRGPRAARSTLVTIGACATAGGIQALRNFADVDEFISARLRHARVHLDAARPRRRSPTTCRSTSSCAAARSTSVSCSR